MECDYRNILLLKSWGLDRILKRQLYMNRLTSSSCLHLAFLPSSYALSWFIHFTRTFGISHGHLALIHRVTYHISFSTIPRPRDWLSTQGKCNEVLKGVYSYTPHTHTRSLLVSPTHTRSFSFCKGNLSHLIWYWLFFVGFSRSFLHCSLWSPISHLSVDCSLPWRLVKWNQRSILLG